MNHLGNAGVFLVQTFFGLLAALFLIRVILIATRSSFFNPVSQMVARLTNPVVAPLRALPRVGGIELAGILLAWVIKVVELGLISVIVGVAMPWWSLLAAAAVSLLDLALLIFIGAIFIQVILSWVAPQGGDALRPLLYQITAPVMNPARRWTPDLGGLDFSPLLALIALQLVRLLLVNPLAELACYGGRLCRALV